MTTTPRTFIACLDEAADYLGDRPGARDLIDLAERLFEEGRKDAETVPEMEPSLPPIGSRVRVTIPHKSLDAGCEFIVTGHADGTDCDLIGKGASGYRVSDGYRLHSANVEVVEPEPSPATTHVEVIDEDGDKLRVRSFEGGSYAATITTERRSGDLGVVGLTRDDVRRVLAVLAPLA